MFFLRGSTNGKPTKNICDVWLVIVARKEAYHFHVYPCVAWKGNRRAYLHFCQQASMFLWYHFNIRVRGIRLYLPDFRRRRPQNLIGGDHSHAETFPILLASLSRNWFKKAEKSLDSPLPMKDESTFGVEAKEIVTEMKVLEDTSNTSSFNPRTSKSTPSVSLDKASAKITITKRVG